MVAEPLRAGLAPRLAQCPAGKVRDEAGFHNHYTERQQLLKLGDQRKPLDVPSQHHIAVRIEPDHVKHVLSDIDAFFKL